MPDLGEPLSKRELDVLGAMSNGASNKEIATELVISPNTVKVHVRNIFTKMGATSRTEAVTRAMQDGLLSNGRDDPLAAPVELVPISAESTPSTISSPISDPAPLPLEVPTQTTPALPNRRMLYIAAGILVLLAAIAAGAFSLLNRSGIVQATPEPFVDVELSERGWFESQPLTTARSGMALTSVGVTLYQIGGETADGINNDVFAFDTRSRYWQPLMEKPTAVKRAGVAVAVGQIYVAGGETPTGSSAIVEVYSPTENAWRNVASLPRALSGMLLVANQEQLYAFGGDENGMISAEAFIYDPLEDNWRPLPPMSTARTDAAGAVINGEVMIVGGLTVDGDADSCEIFSISDESWRECPPMLEKRRGARAVALAGKLYVIGGDSADAVNYGEAYDNSNATWQVVNVPMLASAQNWTNPGVAIVETRIYMLGGSIDGVLQNGNFYYTPLQFRFFFPSTSSGG